MAVMNDSVVPPCVGGVDVGTFVQLNVGRTLLPPAACWPKYAQMAATYAPVRPALAVYLPSHTSTSLSPNSLLNAFQRRNNSHNSHNQTQRQKHRAQFKRLTLPRKLFEILRCPPQ